MALKASAASVGSHPDHFMQVRYLTDEEDDGLFSASIMCPMNEDMSPTIIQVPPNRLSLPLLTISLAVVVQRMREHMQQKSRCVDVG